MKNFIEMSETISELAKALCKFQKEVTNPKKTKTNPWYKKKYADLADIWEAIKTPLHNNGLSITQIPNNSNSVTSILLHESGEYIKGTLTLEPTKTDPQGMGSAITYARRYMMSGMLGIVSDDDDDANTASQPNKSQKQTQSQDNNKPWLNKISPEQQEWIASQIEKGVLKEEVIKKMRDKFKVSKKMKDEIFAYCDTVKEGVS